MKMDNYKDLTSSQYPVSSIQYPSSENTMKKILILFAHPALQKPRINQVLIKDIRNLEGVTFHDLYQHYPEFDIDRVAEQKLLEAHDIIIFQHPFYWYSTPAILCKMIYLPPYVIHGTHAITPETVKELSTHLIKIFEELHSDRIDLQKAKDLSYLNDYFK